MAANAVLLGSLAVTPSLAPPSIRGIFEFKSLGNQGDDGAQGGSRPITAEKKVEAAPAAVRWESLHSPDLTTLVDRLRAAGFPPSVLRAVVDAEVEARFAPRLKELTRGLNDTPYWKTDRNPSMINSRFEAISQIYRERSQVLRELLGQDA